MLGTEHGRTWFIGATMLFFGTVLQIMMSMFSVSVLQCIVF